MERKLIVGLIIGALVIAALLVFFNLPQPDKYIFPKGKKTLVRYYACSLAICTHGCEAGSITEEICLDNDTYTNECNLWCADVCREEFGNCPDDDTKRCCGPKYNLSVSLAERVSLKGGNLIEADVRIFSGTNTDHYITETYDIIKKLFPTFITEEKSGFHFEILDDTCRGVKQTEKQYRPGLIFDKVETYVWLAPIWQRNEWEIKGTGGIFLDPTESREKYGCTDASVPFVMGLIRLSGDAPGYYHCLFKGEVNIWSDWQNNDCADVFFNSTISKYWHSTIECTDPSIVSPELCCKRKINQGETAEYTLKIDNQEGSGSKFFLQWNDNHGGDSDNHQGANCVFWKGSEKITDNKIFVDYPAIEDFTMKCTPIIADTYDITINTWPIIGGAGDQTCAKLVASDFTLEVTPDEKEVIGKDESRKYTVGIWSEMGMDADFDVSLNVPSGLDCPFDTDNSWNGVPDGGYKEAKFTCSGDTGDYTLENGNPITIAVTADGLSESTTRELEILECGGDIRIEFDPPSPVTSGTDLTVKATGLKGCRNYKANISVVYPNLLVKQCLPGDSDWVDDGGTCKMETTANTPGDYTVYAFIDKNKDGDAADTGENNTDNPAVLTIRADAPAYAGTTDNVDRCIFYHKGWGDETCCSYFFGLCTSRGGICDRCGGNCQNYGDPQSNKDKSERYALGSSLCCVYDKDYFSGGPESSGLNKGKSDVPCLTTDNETKKHQLTNDLWWWAVARPRNIYTTLEYADMPPQHCGSNDHCTGAFGGSNPPTELSSATCNEYFGENWCTLTTEDGGSHTYLSWLFIRISPDSRPVYGIETSIVPESGDFSAAANIFLHKKSGGWIHAGSDGVITPSDWSWENIDSMLIGYYGTGYGHLYYVSLLTKGAGLDEAPSTTSFCRDRPDGVDSRYDYYRIVDDGKTCYWGIDCPYTQTGNNDGWSDLGETTRVGPFLEVGCDCIATGTCGKGYCEIDRDGDKFCYYNVQCANGGWRNPKDGEPNLAIKNEPCP